MDEAKEKTVNLNASDVEACRICLATDVKLNSLQNTHLGTFMQSMADFTKSLGGLPNYVCYECAPVFLKCTKLLEKSKTAQHSLLDIFNKNGQINKHLIEEQKKSEINLQSSLGSYLLQNYFYIQYDDDSHTSDFINTESDPNKKIKLENEIKEESGDENEVSDSEILKMIKLLSKDNEMVKDLSKDDEITRDLSKADEIIKDLSKEDETIKDLSKEHETIKDLSKEGEIIKDLSKKGEITKDLSKEEETSSDSDVETIEVPVPVVEIESDDETMGDDFISLKSYSVKMDKPSQGLLAKDDSVPLYNKKKIRPIGVAKALKGRKKKKKSRLREEPTSSRDEDKFVRRFFNINVINKPDRSTSKQYFCRSCPEKYNYVDDARDHVIIGCQRASSGSNRPSEREQVPFFVSTQPTVWEEWPGGSK